jgi:DNA-binding MurR/RpiR family transcriptional regulator
MERVKRSLQEWRLPMNDADGPKSFDDRVALVLAGLSKAEQAVARTFIDRKRDVVLSSAAQIAELARASDATVVRTVRSLGFGSLAELREALLSDLMGASPGDRLAHTLEASSGASEGALGHVIEVHSEILALLKSPAMAPRFERAVEILAAASHRHVFGIGPSGAVATYAALQFNRLGYPTAALTLPGIGVADGLVAMQPGHALLMMAYGPLYREAEVALDEAERLRLPVVLVTDDLGDVVGNRVAEVLRVPRGRADHLATHAGTMVLIEALTIGIAAQSGGRSIDTLDRLSTLRASIDKSWTRRGTRKPKK